MGKMTPIGLDIAKNVFALPGIDADGQVVLRKSLRRGQMQPFFEALAPCLIGMEACASAITRPSMRFVPVKCEDQQATLMLHSACELLSHNGLRSSMPCVVTGGAWHCGTTGRPQRPAVNRHPGR